MELAAGRRPAGVPELVLEYILRHGLYRAHILENRSA